MTIKRRLKRENGLFRPRPQIVADEFTVAAIYLVKSQETKRFGMHIGHIHTLFTGRILCPKSSNQKEQLSVKGLNANQNDFSNEFHTKLPLRMHRFVLLWE